MFGDSFQRIYLNDFSVLHKRQYFHPKLSEKCFEHQTNCRSTKTNTFHWQQLSFSSSRFLAQQWKPGKGPTSSREAQFAAWKFEEKVSRDNLESVDEENNLQWRESYLEGEGVNLEQRQPDNWEKLKSNSCQYLIFLEQNWCFHAILLD